jgi:hypothetical protein
MKSVRVRNTAARNVAWVNSESDPGVEYEIATLPDGQTKCACLGWTFSKKQPKTCKHIEALGLAKVPARTAERYAGIPVSVKSAKGETFNVRRAIAFGDVQF